MLRNYLGKEYTKVEFVGKGQIFLVVFVKTLDARFLKDSDKNYITKDKISFINYGFKGGVMIQFTLYDTKFSFVNCHLESG